MLILPLKATVYLLSVSEVWKDVLWFLKDKNFYLVLRTKSLEEQAVPALKMTLQF